MSITSLPLSSLFSKYPVEESETIHVKDKCLRRNQAGRTSRIAAEPPEFLFTIDINGAVRELVAVGRKFKRWC
jgi:hypothetical protein